MTVEITTIEKIACIHCGSTAVVKFGSYKGVPRYWCKVCKRKFKADGSVFHMKSPAEYVSSALGMYYSGSSISDIRNHLRQEYGYYPSKHIVFEWVDKYTSVASKQFLDSEPSLGNTWIADETVLKLDKGINVWFWDIIDADTRFLIASRASLTRNAKDAQILMEKAHKKAGKYPKEVITDKLGSYNDGISLGLQGYSEHIQGSPFNVRESGESTSQIERFHGTIKDRTKVMRSFRNMDTLNQFMDGYLVFYNYFKPHESLGGKTPAEASKIDYSIKHWKDLIQKPVPKEAGKFRHTEPSVPEYNLPKIGSPRQVLGAPLSRKSTYKPRKKRNTIATTLGRIR